MAKKTSDAAKALTGAASRAYARVKDREPKAEQAGAANGLSIPGIRDGIARLTEIRSGKTKDKGDPWYAFQAVATQGSVEGAEGNVVGEQFSLFYCVNETQWQTIEESVDNLVNAFKLLGETETMRSDDDFGSAVETAVANLTKKKPLFTFTSSSRAMKKREGEENNPDCYKAFLGPLLNLGFERTPREDEDEDEVTEDEVTEDASEFALGDRCSVDFDGAMYDGEITGISYDDEEAIVSFDDDTVSTVPISDLCPPQ